MQIVITLAGHSRRFKAAGFQSPKTLLMVGDRPMIAHVVDIFAPDDDFYFIVNSKQIEESPDLVDILHDLVAKPHVTVIEPHEKGPIFSALQIKIIPNPEPVIISYNDFYVDWNYSYIVSFKSYASKLSCGLDPYMFVQFSLFRKIN